MIEDESSLSSLSTSKFIAFQESYMSTVNFGKPKLYSAFKPGILRITASIL
jgi:hypothetical protein